MAADTPQTESTDPFEVQSKPELVIGIVGPLGVDLEQLISILQDELRRVGYCSSVIRLSQILREIDGLKTKLEDHPEDNRISTHMKAGTELRTRTANGGILARLAVAAIQIERKRITDFVTRPASKRAYILRSIKHRDELQDLKDVYGDGFISISAYAPKDEREWALARQLAKTKPEMDETARRTIATDLIQTDEAEEGKKLGQNVEGAFPLADFFVEASDRGRLEKSLRRLIEILFGNHFQTPSRDEFGMFQAAAAARRSADLSRQVGAALATQEGDIIALGCNDIPKAGGGIYWPDDLSDGRDFALFGNDPSEQAKREIIAEIVDRLKAKYFSEDLASKNSAELTDDLLSGPLKGAQVTNLLEFGRVLHAEMAAITDAAKRGVPTAGTVLYCTTFPCHLCARLIVAAGIKRVVFIEPYPKSKTHDLYFDSTSVDELALVDDKVAFQSFVGVAPQRYDQFFRILGKRKELGGQAKHWDPAAAAPRMRRFQTSYISIETNIAKEIPNWLHAAGLSWNK